MSGSRYLHVIPRYYPYIGGSELYTQEIAEHLARREPDAEVSVYTTDAWDLEHFWAGGKRTVDRPSHELFNQVQLTRFPVRRFPLVSPLFYPVMRRLLTMLSAAPLPDKVALPLLQQLCRTTPLIPALGRALKKEKFDLIHATNAPFDSLIYHSWRNIKKSGGAFVITPFVHLGEPNNPQVRKYYTMRHQLEWLKQADAVITMTNLERDYIASRGVNEAKIHIVGAGVEPNAMTGGDAAAFRQKHNIAGPIVFFQGTAAYDKGTDHLVQAMQKLWQGGEYREATLVIAGPIMSHFQKFYEALPETDRARTRLLGFISPEEKRNLFAAGDVFVMPSRTDSFGIVYMEAWLNNKPVIGARAGGVPGLVTEGQDGLLVDFGDVATLADNIKSLLGDPATSARLGAAGREKVLANYTWEIVFEKVWRIYRQVLKG